MNFFKKATQGIGKVAGNVAKTVVKASKDTVRQTVRSTQDVATEASRHKTALAIGATLLGAGPVAVALVGAGVGAAKRGGGLKDAIRGGAEAGAASVGTGLVRSAASSILTRRAGPIAEAAMPVAEEKPATVLPDRAAGGFRSAILRQQPSAPKPPEYMPAVHRVVASVPLLESGPATMPEVIRMRNRGSRMLNTNRDREATLEAQGSTPVDIAPAAAAATGAEQPQAAAVGPEGMKKYLPLIAVVLIIAALIFFMGKKK